MGAPGGGEEAFRTTKFALKFGYRHLDTVSALSAAQSQSFTPPYIQAASYGNKSSR